MSTSHAIWQNQSQWNRCQHRWFVTDYLCFTATLRSSYLSFSSISDDQKFQKKLAQHRHSQIWVTAPNMISAWPGTKQPSGSCDCCHFPLAVLSAWQINIHLIHRPVGFCRDLVIKGAGTIIIIACNPADFCPFRFFAN